MNSSHVIGTAGVTSMLAGVLVYLTTWPLHAMDMNTAMDAAGLIVAVIGGLGVARINRNRGGNTAVPPTPTKE